MEIRNEIVKHLLKCYFKHIFFYPCCFKTPGVPFKSSLHEFLFQDRVNRTHPKRPLNFLAITYAKNELFHPQEGKGRGLTLVNAVDNYGLGVAATLNEATKNRTVATKNLQLTIKRITGTPESPVRSFVGLGKSGHSRNSV